MPKSYPWGRSTERHMLCVPTWVEAALQDLKRKNPGYETISHLCLDIVVQTLLRAGYTMPDSTYTSPLAKLLGPPRKKK